MATLTMNFRSDALKRDVVINVILPFDKGGKPPYQTAYLLHGMKGSYNTWVESTRIVRAATDRNMAVVMPAGENTFYINRHADGSVYGNYEEFLCKELIEKTRAAFPLSHDRDKTYIGGFSMGGYGALRNGIKYSETFGKIAVFAGALHFFECDKDFVLSDGNVAGEAFLFTDLDENRETDLNPRWLIEQLAAKAQREDKAAKDVFPKLKFFVGEDDDSLREPNIALATTLEQLGADVEYAVTPGGHTWDFVDENLIETLDWLVRDEADFSATGEID